MRVYVYIWLGYGVGVDVWAMGVILFVLLSGFPPFRSPDRNQEELFRLIQKGEVHFLSPYWDNVSEGENLNSNIWPPTNIKRGLSVSSPQNEKAVIIYST